MDKKQFNKIINDYIDGIVSEEYLKQSWNDYFKAIRKVRDMTLTIPAEVKKAQDDLENFISKNTELFNTAKAKLRHQEIFESIFLPIGCLCYASFLENFENYSVFNLTKKINDELLKLLPYKLKCDSRHWSHFSLKRAQDNLRRYNIINPLGWINNAFRIQAAELFKNLLRASGITNEELNQFFVSRDTFELDLMIEQNE